MEAILTAVIGLIGVAIGSLLSPWFAFRIEVQRGKAEARRRVIAEARDYVSSKQFGVSNFALKPFFLSLEVEFPPDLVRAIREFDGRSSSQPVEDREDIKAKVLSELSNIERQWNLI